MSGKIKAAVYGAAADEEDEGSPLFVKLDVMAMRIGKAGMFVAFLAFVVMLVLGVLAKMPMPGGAARDAIIHYMVQVRGLPTFFGAFWVSSRVIACRVRLRSIAFDCIALRRIRWHSMAFDGVRWRSIAFRSVAFDCVPFDCIPFHSIALCCASRRVYCVRCPSR